MEAFAPLPALIGGLLIGLGSAVLWVGNGRIAGISGIFGQLLPPAGWGLSTPLWIAIAGLLTGLGTKIGNGCTSGHGICGLARLSARSFVAVGIFFAVAVLTVTVTGVV
jgi:uncharacterized protein